MSTATLTLKEQLAPIVSRELEVIEIGATAFGIGKATRIFRDAPTAVFDDVYGNLKKQTPATAAIVISGLIAARSGVPISFLVPQSMQDDLAEAYENFEVTADTELMFGRLLALKERLATERAIALKSSIQDGSLAQAKSAALVKSLGNLKTKGVKFTEEEKQAIIAAL